MEMLFSGFPRGVLCRTPELSCCQEVWVPAETPLHLPSALQVDRSDILFSHWQITADRQRESVDVFNCCLSLP